jgi:CHAT domain-containing protein
MAKSLRRLLEWLCFTVACCAGASILLIAETALAQDAQVGDAPALSSPFHSGRITRLAVDPDSRVLVTASEDKTVRLWNLPSGQLLRVITPPEGPGHLGEIHALAISPDGKTLACAGYTGKKNPRKGERGIYYEWEIYLYELQTGRLLHTLASDALVDNLVYSKSGKFLLASSSEMPSREYDASNPLQAVQIFTTLDYMPIKDAPLAYYEAIANFDAQDRLLVIGGLGGTYRAELFTADLELIESRGMSWPLALSFAPDGGTFAIAQYGPRIAIHSARDLVQLHQPDLRGIQPRDEKMFSDATIAWSMDGKFLYMADASMCGAKGCWIRKWDDAGRGRAVDVIVSPHRVTHIVPLQSGGVAFGTAGAAFGLLDGADKRSLYVENTGPSVAAVAGSREADPIPAAAVPEPPSAAAEPQGNEGQCFSLENYSRPPGGDLLYEDGTWVYFDHSGKIQMSVPFRSASSFSQGRAEIAQGNKAGYIDKTGRLVIAPTFDFPAYAFTEGRAAVRVGDNFAYIDRAGKMIINPQFSTYYDFSQGLARMHAPQPRGWGYMNILGEVVILPRFEGADDFHEGLAVVEIDGKMGYIDSSGQWAIKPTFTRANRFSEGLAAVRKEECTARGCTYNFIDKTGAVVLHEIAGLESYNVWFSDGMLMIRDARYKNGFVDRAGRIAIPPQFKQARPFSEGLAAVRTVQGKWGYVDKQGTFIIEPQFEEAFPFSEGLAAVKQQKWGYIDQTGRMVVEPKLLQAYPFAEGLAAACIATADLAAFVLPPKLAVSAPQPDLEDVAEEPPVRHAHPLTLDSDEQKQLAEMHATVNRLSQSRRYVEALPVARQAMALVRLKLAPDDPGNIEPLLSLSRVLHGIGNYRTAVRGSGFSIDEYREAERLFDAALTLKGTTAGQEDEEGLRILDEIADVKASAKQFDEAMDLKQSVLAGRQRTNGANHPTALKAATDLDALRVAKAIAAGTSKNLAKALPLAEANLRDAETRLGSQHPNVAVALMHLSQIYAASRAGFQQGAIELMKQALELRLSVLGADHWDTVTSAMQLARLYQETGEYGDAKRLLQQAVDGARKALGPDDPDLRNLSSQQKDDAERNALGPDDPDAIKLLSKQADMLRSMGKYREAAVLLEDVLAFWDRQIEQDGPRRTGWEFRETLEALAGTYRLLGEYERSALLYQRLIATKNQGSVMRDFQVAGALHGIGKVNRLRGEHGEAKARLQEALALLEPDVRATEPKAVSIYEGMTVNILQELSAVAVAEGNPLAAREWLMRAAPLDQKIRDYDMYMPFHRPIELKPSRGDRYFDQFLWLVGHHFGTDTASVDQAFGLVLNRKRLSIDLQSRVRAFRASLSSKGQKKWDQLAKVRSELAGLMLKGSDMSAQGEYRQRFILLFEQHAALEADLTVEMRGPIIDPLAKISKQEILQRLRGGTALIEFVRIPDIDYGQQDLDLPSEQRGRYLAFVLTALGRLSLVDIGSAEQVDALATAIQSQMRDNGNIGQVRATLKAAYGTLWRPLMASLADADKIVIGPDSHLHELPFAALIDANDQYLVQRYRFAYIGTARDLLSKASEPAQQIHDLVLFADPAFDDQTAPDVEAPVETGSAALPKPFRALPGTAEEAHRIPPLVTGNRGKTVFLGKDATETALKRTARPRILHLATHGFYLAQQNFGSDVATYESALVSSGLALAGANHAGRINSANQDDGLLTALEVMGMDLTGTQLVVLSACDTGAGAVTSGQGVIGLGPAFTFAGARSVLMSLWPVDDTATVDLMTGFYSHLRNLPAGEALHRTELDLIRNMRSRSGSDDPKRWAPFILQDAAAFSD